MSYQNPLYAHSPKKTLTPGLVIDWEFDGRVAFVELSQSATLDLTGPLPDHPAEGTLLVTHAVAATTMVLPGADTDVTWASGEGESTWLRFLWTGAGYVWTGTPVGVVSATVPEPLYDAEILVMDGQSNSAGQNYMSYFDATTHSLITPDPADEFQRVYLWNLQQQKFIKLRWGYTYAGLDGFGAEIGYAQRWEQENPTGNLYIVKRGTGGASISQWDAGTESYNTLVTHVGLAKSALTAQGKTPFVKAFLWNQGESDSSNPTGYSTKLASLISRLTTDGVIEAATRRVIVVQSDSALYPEQYNYVSNDPQAVLVDAKDYPGNPGDEVHYTGRSQYLLGYTDAYNKVYGQNDPYPFPLIPTQTNLTYTRNTAPNTNGKPVAPAEAVVGWESDYWLKFGPWGYGGAGGGCWYHNDSRTFAEINIQSTGFTFKSEKTGLAQKFNVYVDDVLHGTLDEASVTGSVLTYEISGLSNAVHTIRLEPVDGGYLFLLASQNSTVSAVSSGGGTPSNGYPVVAAGTAINGTDTTNINFIGAWANASQENTRYGDPGSAFEVNFNATSVAFDAALMGGYVFKVDVYIDGVLDAVDITSSQASDVSVVRYEKTGLAAGAHTLKVVGKGALGSNVITVSRVRVASAGVVELVADPLFTKVEQTDTTLGWKGNGGWQITGNGKATMPAPYAGLSPMLETTVQGMTVGVTHVMVLSVEPGGGDIYLDTGTDAGRKWGGIGRGVENQVFLFTPTATSDVFTMQSYDITTDTSITRFSIKKL